jgi:hypothetical protein
MSRANSLEKVIDGQVALTCKNCGEVHFENYEDVDHDEHFWECKSCGCDHATYFGEDMNNLTYETFFG